MERLLLYRWPGNVRQLQNEMRRMVALAEPNSTLDRRRDLRRHPRRAAHLPPPTPANGREIAVRLNDKLLADARRASNAR